MYRLSLFSSYHYFCYIFKSMHNLKRYTSFNKLKSAIVLDTTNASKVNDSNADFQALINELRKHIVTRHSTVKLKSEYAAKNNK